MAKEHFYLWGMMYKGLIRPLLFIPEPEQAHNLTFRGLQLLMACPFIRKSFHRCSGFEYSVPVTVGHLVFPNGVGLAAGFDKNALLIDCWQMLGFGFVEVGTITPKPQSGNPPPRLFRLPADQALINRMGFNNDGAVAIARRLRNRKSKIIVGGNIGKNRDTPNDKAVVDYLFCLECLYDVVDFFTINVSSPNTPGLRDLQQADALYSLLHAIQQACRRQPVPRPVFVKISPDLTFSELDGILSVVEATGVAGIIACNTTLSRDGLKSDRRLTQQPGGLSGRPLKQRSDEVLWYLAQHRKKNLCLIGCGGILSTSDALDKFNRGASLIQLYTGLIYEGPALIRNILKAVHEHSQQRG
jgi:dihydroorotate dehydrogenase